MSTAILQFQNRLTLLLNTRFSILPVLSPCKNSVQSRFGIQLVLVPMYHIFRTLSLSYLRLFSLLIPSKNKHYGKVAVGKERMGKVAFGIQFNLQLISFFPAFFPLKAYLDYIIRLLCINFS